MWTMPLLAFEYLTVTVSLSVSVRYTKHCVDGQPSEHSLSHTLTESDTRVVLFRRSTVETVPATKIDSRYCYDFGHY